MGVSKVILNDETLMDVTDTTVDEDNLLSGETALGADGETVRGNVTVPTKTSDLVNDSGFVSAPSQTGQSGKFLTTNGTNTSWASVTIPTKTSDLTNDSGFISTETDPTVPSWAKQSTKPSYTAIEVGAQPTITANGLLKGNGSGTISAAVSGTDYQAPLPSQTGNNGKFLTTNGSALSWATVDALPSQSGHIGQFLYTNGTTVSWEDSPSDVMLVTLTGTGEGDLSADKTVEEIIEAAILDGKQVNLVFDEYIYPLISYTQTDVVFEISGSTELLIVDGSSDNGNDYWDAYSVPIALPSQSGQSGKYLTTNGVTTSWANPKSSYYGTSGTTAGTAEKVVTCSDFVLKSGAVIGVLFSTANTAATPTLNVNSTGAKSIYVGSATPSATTNVLKWSANTMVYFIYDGTNFRYITSVSAGSVAPSRGAGTWYGTCSVTASTTAKTSTINNYVLTKGAIVSVYCSTANTANAPTLNVNSTGAIGISYHGTVTSSTNPLKWSAGETLTFIYTGTYYECIGRTGYTTAEDALPAQSGNSGKFLTTNGTDASWATVTVPTKTSDLTNDSGFATETYVGTAIAAAIGDAISASY